MVTLATAFTLVSIGVAWAIGSLLWLRSIRREAEHLERLALEQLEQADRRLAHKGARHLRIVRGRLEPLPEPSDGRGLQ